MTRRVSSENHKEYKKTRKSRGRKSRSDRSVANPFRLVEQVGGKALAKFMVAKQEQQERLDNLERVAYDTKHITHHRTGKVLEVDFDNLRISKIANAKLQYRILEFFRNVASLPYEVGGFLDFDDGTKSDIGKKKN